MNTNTALTEDQVKEFQTILGEVKGGWAQVKDLPATFETLREETRAAAAAGQGGAAPDGRPGGGGSGHARARAGER